MVKFCCCGDRGFTTPTGTPSSSETRRTGSRKVRVVGDHEGDVAVAPAGVQVEAVDVDVGTYPVL
jgi:hypothetical protein